MKPADNDGMERIGGVPDGLAGDLLQERERRLVLSVCRAEGISPTRARHRIAKARKHGRVVTFLDYLEIAERIG